MKSYNVPVDLLQAVVDYLTSKPWGEVNFLVVALAEISKQQQEEQKEEVKE